MFNFDPYIKVLIYNAGMYCMTKPIAQTIYCYNVSSYISPNNNEMYEGPILRTVALNVFFHSAK